MKRSSRSSSSWEAPVLGFLALALALSGWALYRDMNSSPKRASGGRAVGTIVYRQRQAERKYSGQVLWGSLAQGAPVYDLDAIRTASDSSATIYLADKTSIELGEDTLLVLDLGGETKKLDLSGGTLRVKREGGSGSLEVTTGSGDLALGSGTVALSKKEGSVSIAVSAGRASFRQAPKPRGSDSGPSGTEAAGTAASPPALELDSTKAVSISSGGKVAEAALEPLSPASGKELAAIGERVKVDFSWIGPASFSGFLEIAADPGFSRLREAKPVLGSMASLELAPGEYYWRLKDSGKGQRAPSPSAWLRIVASGPPRPIRPAPGAAISSAQGTRSLVDFAWSSSPKAEGYRLEVSSDSAFAERELGVASSRTVLSTDRLGPGRWYWRVIALFPSEGLEAPSAVSSFEISAQAAKPKTAWHKGAGTPFEASTLAARAGALNLSWEATEGADSYRVTIARDEGFRERVYSAAARTNAVSVAASLDEGSYYVEVVPLVAGKEGEPSEPRMIVIKKSSPISLVSPREGAPLPPAGAKADFTWSDPNGGTRFKVEVASDRAFAAIVGSATASSEKAAIELPPGLSGALYWRVFSLGAKGESLASSGISSFVATLPLATPSVLSPADGEVIDAYRRASFTFAWKASEGATEYRLSLYRATGGAMTLLREWRTDRTEVEVKSMDFLAVDAYAWKLVALGKAGESPAATSYFQVAQSAQVGAPKLKVPEIIYVR